MIRLREEYVKFLSLKTVILFNWKGGSGNSTKKYFFDINENLDEPIQKSGVLDELIKANNKYFEIDSNCPNSSMLPSCVLRLKKTVY